MQRVHHADSTRQRAAWLHPSSFAFCRLIVPWL